MKAAFVIYDGMTTLDFIGVYDALTRLKTMGFMADFTWDVCALVDTVTDGTGLRLLPSRVGGSLAGYDLIIVPGGPGARARAGDPAFLDWLRTAAPSARKASVCSGALILGAAGFLRGRRATTHRTAFDELRALGMIEVVDERVVDEGEVVTARGVSSSIDLGLYLVEQIAGSEVRRRIQRQMDYQPDVE
jgi:transcriptional regulator GlxA family with amidase domain